MEKLGPQSAETLKDFNEKQAGYITQIQSQFVQKHHISDKYQNTNTQLLELITLMVSFSPLKRISAEDCLTSPYFVDIRKPNTEQPASKEIKVFNQFTSKEEAVEFLRNEI